MAEQPHEYGKNPLDDFAAEMSEGLSSTPVEMTDASADSVEGGQVWMRQSAARQVRASALRLEESGAGFIRAGSVEAHHSGMGMAVARQISLRDSNSSVVVAQDVRADNVRTLLILTTRVQGNVKALFTPLTALAAGAGFAAVLWLLRQGLVRLNPLSQRKDQTVQ